MLIKWIVCEVPTDRRDAFSKAQRHWQRLETVAGFLGQTGGWDAKEPSRACVLGLWANAEAYARFMDHVHDPIFEESGQRETYVASRVARVEALFDITGIHSRMQAAVPDAKLLRVADCFLKPGRSEHFIEMQKTVWNPAMAESEGMLAGAFGTVQDEPDRYVVTTFWRDESAHQAYVENSLPGLQTRARIDQDLQRISGHLVRLDPDWCLAGK